MFFFIIVWAFATLLSALLTPLAIRLGHAINVVDQPGGRRQHSGVIPRIGGLAISASFLITVLLTQILPLLLPSPFTIWFPASDDINENRRLFGLLAGTLFCTVAGFLDDRYDWPPLPQYTAQFIASLIAIAGIIFIKHVNNPLGNDLFFGEGGFPWWIAWTLTIFWYMGMMNTVNWLDGLNGLVSGVTAILCLVLALHMIFEAEPPQMSVAILPIALLGAVLGFLPFNFAPARVFMGSSGSYFLGFAVAALGIIGGARLATVMLVFGLPALDVAWLIIQRWRRGLSPGQSGRDHLHFRLLDMGWHERTIVLGYWGFCALFGLLTLALDDRVYKLVALVGLGLLALIVLFWASNTETVKREN